MLSDVCPKKKEEREHSQRNDLVFRDYHFTNDDFPHVYAVWFKEWEGAGKEWSGTRPFCVVFELVAFDCYHRFLGLRMHVLCWISILFNLGYF